MNLNLIFGEESQPLSSYPNEAYTNLWISDQQSNAH